MSTPTASPPNPGYLKLDLCAKGVRLDTAARAAVDAVPAGASGAELPRGIELVLPEDVWVKAPIDGSAAESPYLLSGDGDRVTLQQNGSSFAVRVVPQPAFYALTTTSGLPMWRVGTTYGGFIAINPSFACGYSLRGAPCRFCRNGTGVSVEQGFLMSVQDVVEVVRAAFAEGAVEFVYFNLAYVGSEDAGIAFLEPYIRAVKRHFDTIVAVQIHPPKTNRWIDRTYAMGVDAVSYSIDIHDPDILARRCAGRVRYIGRERYYDALAHAATVFPNGTAWSELAIGLESAESTIRGIDTLTAAGVLPVLSLVRAADEKPSPTVEDVAAVCAHLFHAVRDAKINMGWVRDLGFAMTPLEARFFAGDDARRTVTMQHFYRSRIGNLAARSLARLRRRLRVRQVSDSFDSSHL